MQRGWQLHHKESIFASKLNSAHVSRIAIIHNTVAPYRHPLFEKLSNDFRYDFRVFYCSRYHANRKWESFPRRFKYAYTFLPGVTFKEVSFNPTIINEIIRGRYDAVVVYGWVDLTMQLAFFFSKLIGIPVILWIENVEEPNSLIGMVTRPLRRFFLTRADSVLTPGNVSRKYVINMGVREEKIRVAPNTIDNSYFVRLSSRYKKQKKLLKKSFSVENKIILCVSQLVERKGVEYLIRAFIKLQKEIADIGLIIVGSGPLKEKLNLICKENGICNVKFIPSGLSQKTVIKLYSIADVFVLPTLSDRAPLVINEALACGLPIVTTIGAGNSADFVLNGVNGFVVSPGNIEELFQALVKILSDEQLRTTMGRNSLRVLMEKASLAGSVRGYTSALEEQLRCKVP